jgi:hypothetical protein
LHAGGTDNARGIGTGRHDDGKAERLIHNLPRRLEQWRRASPPTGWLLFGLSVTLVILAILALFAGRLPF